MSRRGPGAAPAAGPPLSDVTCRPFRVRPEARLIWQQHTGGTVGALLGQPPPPPPGLPAVAAGGADCVNAREKLRTNRSHGRHSGGGRQPMRALPINGVTEEALSHSRSSSSAASFAASPRSPRRHIDLSQLSGDLAAVEGVHGVRVISPGRQHTPTENGGRIPSPVEGIPSRFEGNPSSSEGFRRVPSSGNIGSASVSPGVTRSSSATDLDRRLPPFPHSDRTIPVCASNNSKGRPAPAANGAHLPSPRANGEGIPSRTADAAWTGGGDVSEGARAVRLDVPGDVSDRSSNCDLRRERIRALIGSLRRSPTDGSARAVAADARELRATGRAAAPVAVTSESPLSRFSDETRLSFREQALERARAPYRAPSLAASRKFKSSETIRDGATARPSPEATARLLSKRKSQSVAKLTQANAARSADRPAAVATRSEAVNNAVNRREPTNGAVNRREVANGAVNRGETVNGVATRGEAVNGGVNSIEALRMASDASDHVDSSPKQSSLASSEPRDFVRLNRQLAASQRSRRARSLPRSEAAPPAGSRPPPGSLPRYLVRRQEQWRQEEQRRLLAAPDPACPPGHSRMPDHERLHTLHVLRDNHETLLTELRALPIAHSSSRLVAQRADIERQLQKLEEGIRIFSRPKVFIKNDG